jgi:anthranilate phosphoribosyltransferase
VAEVRGGSVAEHRLDAAELGIRGAAHGDLSARDLAGAARLLQDLLAGREHGPARDMLVLNAAMAIVAAGVAETARDGVAAATAALDSGEAARTLERLRSASRA